MKNCCFCFAPVGGDAVFIYDGYLYPVVEEDAPPSFLLTRYPSANYAHLECFERAKVAFQRSEAGGVNTPALEKYLAGRAKS